MNYSPLLPQEKITRLITLLKIPEATDNIILQLNEITSQEEQVHILRFLSFQNDLSDISYNTIMNIWRQKISSEHVLDTQNARIALEKQAIWWDLFEEDKSEEYYNDLEDTLNKLGNTSEGVDYFRWIALHPPYFGMDRVSDEQRRGAIICIAKYAFFRNDGSSEIFIARHMDDWINIQTDVINILVATKARIFKKTDVMVF